MEIFGIGAPELVFIVVIALIVLGPKDMQKAGRTIGRWLNNLVNSEGWRAFQRTSREIRNLPTNLMRQANLEELQETGRDIHNAIDPNWEKRRPAPPAPRPDAPPGVPPAPDSPEADPANPPDDRKSDA
jgi:sec-independent protein translocase protein TatB